MIRKFDGVIFDLDGVIVHTDDLHYKAWKELADSLSIEFDEETNKRLRGVSRMESLDIILEKYKGEILTDHQKNKLAEKKNEIYVQYLEQMTESDIGVEVRETLDNLKEQGIKIAIGSSSKNARFILKKTRMNDVFDAISDGNNIRNSKPNPEVFLKAAEFLNVLPEKCMVVEDACAGIDAAVRAEMKSAGIGDAYTYDKTNYPIKSIKDILLLVESYE